MQIAANCYKLLQIPANPCKSLQIPANPCKSPQNPAKRCGMLQITSNCCQTLQNAATSCGTLHSAANHVKSLPNTANHSITLQNTIQRCKMLQNAADRCKLLRIAAKCWKTLQSAAKHCKMLWRAANCCKLLPHTAKRCTQRSRWDKSMQMSTDTITSCITSDFVFKENKKMGCTPPKKKRYCKNNAFVGWLNGCIGLRDNSVCHSYLHHLSWTHVGTDSMFLLSKCNTMVSGYSNPSLSRTPLSRILDTPDKSWPPENQTQVIFTQVSQNLLKPDKKWPPEVSALTRDYCTLILYM